VRVIRNVQMSVVLEGRVKDRRIGGCRTRAALQDRIMKDNLHLSKWASEIFGIVERGV